VARYEDPKVVDDDALNVMRLGVKDAITQTYEVLREYCEATNQLVDMKSQPWYHFARLVRNSMSHDYTLNFRMRRGEVLRDQSLQFSDRCLVLKASQEGQELDLDLFPFQYAFELVDMMRRFAADVIV
jgi:hypothetical protein